MPDPHILDVFDIPSKALIALDWRPYRFAIQPYHYLIRAAHVVSMAAFFGGIAAVDLRLIGLWQPVPLRRFSEQIMPWIHVTFAIAMISGVALFFYDPVHVGSHAYFSFKLILTVLGMINAALFQRTGYIASLPADGNAVGHPDRRARIIGVISLLLWTGVVVCACLNVEGVPKRLLRG